MSFDHQATYCRTALLLGLMQGEEVLRWAERAITRDPSPPDPLLELVLIPATDLSGLRHALWPLVVEPDPMDVLRALLAHLHHSLVAGRMSLRDAITILRQMRSMLRLPPLLYDQLNDTLVRQAASGDAVPAWLEGFAADRIHLD